MRPQRKTPQPGRAWGDKSNSRYEQDSIRQTSIRLFAEADAISASIPYLMTRERKRATVIRLCGVWLSALSAARLEADHGAL